MEWWWVLAFTARISSARAAWLSGIARAVPRSQPAQPIVPLTPAADLSFRCVFRIFFVTCASHILLRISYCTLKSAMHRIAHAGREQCIALHVGCPNKLASTSRLECGTSHNNLVRAHRLSSKVTCVRLQASLARNHIAFRVRHVTPQACASTSSQSQVHVRAHASIATTQAPVQASLPRKGGRAIATIPIRRRLSLG